MGATVKAMVIGAALGVAVMVAAAFAADVCDLDRWSGATVLLCRGVDPVRVWPWPPAWPVFEDHTPRPADRIGRAHGVASHSWGVQASRAKVFAVFRGARS